MTQINSNKRSKCNIYIYIYCQARTSYLQATAKIGKADELEVEEICYSLAFSNKSIIFVHFASLITPLENDKWYGNFLQHRRLSNS
jgi:hypothetical protein